MGFMNWRVKSADVLQQGGVIAPDDTRIIAISASRFGVYVAERPLPLIMTTLFPIVGWRLPFSVLTPPNVTP